MKGQFGKENLKRKCPTCNKKRIPRLFPKGARSCELCKIAKKNGIKKERKEEGIKIWIKRLDDLIRPQVRARKVCESPRIHKCNESWQWCHGLSRSYHSTRWMLKNGFCMCSGEHKFYTDRPLEWEEVLKEKWSEEGLNEMKKLALTPVVDKTWYKTLFEQLNY